MNRDRDALVQLFESLDDERRNSLFDYAEFLLARDGPVQQHPGDPQDIPKPENESVVGAIKRMKQTYPMIDSMKIFATASNLMTEHMVNGRDAEEVIGEIEDLFEQSYRSLLKDLE